MTVVRSMSHTNQTSPTSSGGVLGPGEAPSQERVLPHEQPSTAITGERSALPERNASLAPARSGGVPEEKRRGGWWLMLLLPAACCGGPFIIAAIAAAGVLAWGVLGAVAALIVSGGLIRLRRRAGRWLEPVAGGRHTGRVSRRREGIA